MKKIKLFALAVMAMLGTNAFAADVVTSSGLFNITVADGTSNATITGFRNDVTEEDVKDLEIPATLTNTDGGDDYTVVAIKENAFVSNPVLLLAIETVTFEENDKLTTIGAGAFEGAQNLESIDFTGLTKLATIGAGALAYTYLTEVDLSATVVETLNPIFTSTTHDTNVKIASVKLPATCAGLAEGAFKNCSNLATIDLKAVKTIGKNAFEGTALTAAVIGTAPKTAFGDAEGISVGDEAFKDCAALTTVELGKQIGGSVADDAFFGCEALATLKFNEITAAISADAFNLPSVNSIIFQKEISTEDMIPANAFVDAFPTGGTVKYLVALESAAAKFINQGAFAASATTNTIKFSTTTEVITVYGTDVPYKVEFDEQAAEVETFFIGSYDADADEYSLLKDKNSSYYYYYYKADGSNVAIAQKNGENEADIRVYAAYIDVNNDAAALYYQPLRVVKGNYVVADGQVVIIRSDKADGVVAFETADPSTMAYDSSSKPINDLELATAAVGRVEVETGTDYLDNDANSLFFLNNPVTSGFGFTQYDKTKQKGLGKNAVYMVCDAVAAGRLNVIWLDEDGNVEKTETTAIESMKQASDESAESFNLAGQRIGAGYKGIVIKNGKKVILK